MTILHSELSVRTIDSLEAFRTNKSSLGNAATLGAVAAATVAIDRGVGYIAKRREDDSPFFISEENDGDRATFVLPGCRSDGQLIAHMMNPQLRNLGDTTFAAYPRRGFSLDAVKEGLLEERQKNKEKVASFYAISMGGMVLSRLLADEDFINEFGDIDTAVYDSSPADYGDVRRQSRMALHYANIFMGSWAADRAAARVMAYQSRKEVQHDECVTDAQLIEHLHTTAQAPLHMVQSQGKFIKQANLKNITLRNSTQTAYYVASPYDPVVDTESAARQYGEAFGGTMNHIIDSSRPHGSHASGPAYQSKIVELLSGRKQYRTPPWGIDDASNSAA